MSRRRRRPLQTEPFLGPTGEHAWQELRTQEEWATRFWLGFLFSTSSTAIGELESRARRLALYRGAAITVERPRSPEELRSVARYDFIEQSLSVNRQLWIESLRSDADGLRPSGWAEAWRWALERLNERREALREQGGGLLLALPIELKALVRQTAPDLWSIRSLALDIDAPAGAVVIVPDSSSRSTQAEPKLEVLPGIVGPAARHAGDAIAAAKGGLMAEAVDHARQAVSLTDQLTTAYSDALALLSGVEHRAGDEIAASRHMAEAVASLQRFDSIRGGPQRLIRRNLATRSIFLGDARSASADLEAALTAFEDAIRWSEPMGDGPDPELELLHAKGLIGASRTNRILGRPVQSEPLARRALTECRAMVTRGLAEAQVLLLRSLFELGGSLDQSGRFQPAYAAYEEASSTLEALKEVESDGGALDPAMLSFLKARVAASLGELKHAEESISFALAAVQSESHAHSDGVLQALALGLSAQVAARQGDGSRVERFLSEFATALEQLAQKSDSSRLDVRLVAQAVRDVLDDLGGKFYSRVVFKLATLGLLWWKRVRFDGSRTIDSYIQAASMHAFIARFFYEGGDLKNAVEALDMGLSELPRAPVVTVDTDGLFRAQCDLLRERAHVHGLREDWSSAVTDLLHSVESRRRIHGELDTGNGALRQATDLERLAEALARQQEWERAVESLSEALAVVERLAGAERPSVWGELLRAKAYTDRARAYAALGQTEPAAVDADAAAVCVDELGGFELADDEKREFEFVRDRLRDTQKRSFAERIFGYRTPYSDK